MRRSQSAQIFCPAGKGLLLGGLSMGAVTCFVTICCGGCGGWWYGETDDNSAILVSFVFCVNFFIGNNFWFNAERFC